MKKLIEKLKKKKLTISSAESVTGGLFASEIVAISGSSEVFKEAIITYANEAKVKYLKVSEKTLKHDGAVSYQCAKEMVIGLKKISKADIAVAFTGIAGPTGGSSEKPVGLTYIAIYYQEITVLKEIFTGNRNSIRKQCIKKAKEEIMKVIE